MDKIVPHILIVDDEEDLAELCADAFEMEGCRVSMAISGKQAAEIISKEDDLDAVISDAIMPGTDGHALLQILKDKYSNDLNRMPFFYFATGSVTVTEAGLISDGAKGLISKPYDLDEMVRRVKGDLEK